MQWRFGHHKYHVLTVQPKSRSETIFNLEADVSLFFCNYTLAFLHMFEPVVYVGQCAVS